MDDKQVKDLHVPLHSSTCMQVLVSVLVKLGLGSIVPYPEVMRWLGLSDVV
ncbi:hypothetical protein [Sulfitobacter guttiformis]|uniref:hypothetical protein n=1 Tax=Sulfitobacter guttiformis TaxID=74349 RepID=UPI000A7A0624|nr:hypothetical protein [Sulfitobacter guttiformis]KIN72409.1 hypothetical protein Z949_1582 [Sulfitobacter guttiformis KCTC 32187]